MFYSSVGVKLDSLESSQKEDPITAVLLLMTTSISMVEEISKKDQ